MDRKEDATHSITRTSSEGPEKLAPYSPMTVAEEKRLIRKIDRNVVPLMVLFYLLSFLDRTNIGNARLNGLEKDLKLSDYDYRIALTILYVPYIAFELVSNLLVKKVGAKIWLPGLVCAWGIVGTLQGIVVNKEGLWADRFFLGLTEAGILPAIILYLSSWYKPHELQFRIGMFWVASSLAGSFGGLLAAALGLINTKHMKGWQAIFIIEGIITVIAGVIGYFLMPNDIESSKFTTAEEKEQIAARMISATGHSEVHEKFAWSEVGSVFASLHMWLLMIMAFGSGIAVYSVAYFLPTILSGLGKRTVWETQLLSVPPYVLSAICSLAGSYYSDKFKQRTPFVIFPQLVAIAGLAILYTCTRDKRPFGARYFAIMILVSGIYTAVPAYLALASNSFANHYRRATALAMMIVMTNSGGLASTWLYRKNEAPNYTKGYMTVIAMLSLATLCAVILRYHFIRINRQRATLRDAARSTDETMVPGGPDRGDRDVRYTYTI